jgi:hypothetical protein
MNSNSNYETLYGVGLLDDLHNYFPALLYDSSSFGSVRDVLGYIQTQTRNRFDLFSYGLREYQAALPEPSASNPLPRRVVRTSFASIPPSLATATSTLLRSPATIPSVSEQVTLETTTISNPSTIQQILGRTTGTIPNIFVDIAHLNRREAEEEEEDADADDEAQASNFVTNALLSLLNLPPTALTLNRNYMPGSRAMDQFLQPVPVRPTPEQIAENTTLGNLVSDTEHACAICQDTLLPEQEGRKLNACGHWFHKGCIDTWLGTNVHCPVCRHDIREALRTNSPSAEE